MTAVNEERPADQEPEPAGTRASGPVRRVHYVAGGPVQAENGIYLERPADRELLAHCLRGDFVYILTARQLGKSSLMFRTVEALEGEACRAVVIDLQSLGKPEQAEQWYRGLLVEIDNGLDQPAPQNAANELPDRRIIYVAVVNCVEEGLAGRQTVGSINYIKIFLTEPVSEPTGVEIVGEIVDIVELGVDDMVLHDIVQLYR